MRTYCTVLYLSNQDDSEAVLHCSTRTILVVQDARTTETVSFTNQLSHSVDRPRAFLHVLRVAASVFDYQLEVSVAWEF